MEGKLLYKIYVTGCVQRVGLRLGIARKARDLGIKGFVKNLTDGTVYIEAEGSGEQINDLIEWCKKDPGPDLVRSINTYAFPPANYTEFRIAT